MKIIIDGCDFTGKTTLIKKLQSYYNDDRLSYLHFSYRDRRDFDFYNTMLDKQHFIADRHFLDEAIYPQVFNRCCALTPVEFDGLIERCKSEDIKMIILTCSDDELIRRTKLRGNEEPEVLANLLNINNGFKQLATAYDLPLFDTTQNELQEFIDYIEGEQNEKYKSNVFK